MQMAMLEVAMWPKDRRQLVDTFWWVHAVPFENVNSIPTFKNQELPEKDLDFWLFCK